MTEKKAVYCAGDDVKHPKHYKLDGLAIESIDVVSAVVGSQFEGFCIGNVLKYVIRYRKKAGVEDLKKARVYLDWVISFLESNEGACQGCSGSCSCREKKEVDG